jgi:DNA-directed RNA polymerase beta' subunit
VIDINNFDAIEISLASSKQIRGWSSGEVTKPETINYRTLKPEKDGLFCERIFGPTKDWECYCGKYKRVRYKGIVCERCGVEVTRSKVRRERMGHVDLAAPVSHIWFFKGVPSRIGYLLDMAPKELEKVLYFAASIVTWVDDEARTRDTDKLAKEIDKVLDSYSGEREERVLELRESLARREVYLESGKQTGFSAEDHLWADSLDVKVAKLSADDREKLLKDLRKSFEADIADTEAYIEDAAERVRQVWELFKTMEPKQIEHDETLFRELKERFGSSYGFGDYFRGGMGAEAIRDLLQQVDLEAERIELLDQVKTAKGQKQARAVKRLKVVSAFIQSGNKPEWMILSAVPVIAPELRPMVQLDGGRFATSDLNDLYRRVINRNNRLKRLLELSRARDHHQEREAHAARSGRRADRQRPPRPPGHRAEQPPAEVALRHPQGQAGPLPSESARQARRLLGPFGHRGRPEPQAAPVRPAQRDGARALQAVRDEEAGRPRPSAQHQEREAHGRRVRPEVWDVLDEVIREHPVLLNRAPDAPSSRHSGLRAGARRRQGDPSPSARLHAVQRGLRRRPDGRPSSAERRRASRSAHPDALVQQHPAADLWNACTDEVADAMVENLDELNPIFMMANSGARGSFKQIRQLAGMRGLMANPKGEIIERPIKANFVEGLSVLEYFISTHGARKGLADTALRTADSGYLTRRLVDVAQDVIIREPDCGTKEYIEIPVFKDGDEPNDNLIGRIAALEFKTKRGRVLVAQGSQIDRAEFADIVESYREELRARQQRDGRGALGAEVRGALRGLPGLLRAGDGDRPDRPDRRRGRDHRRPVDRRAGHAADDAHVPHRRRRRRRHHARPAARRRAVRGAQAEGPGEDRRAGRRDLDRGVRQGSDRRDHRRGGRGAPSHLPAPHPPLRHPGEKIVAGRQLNEGSLYPHELLAVRGRTETEQYLVKEVQAVYKSQGVDINDKHIELIVRQMLKKVRSTRRATPTTCRGSSSTASSSRIGPTPSWSRRQAASRPISRRSSSASPRPRSTPTRSSRPPPSRRRRRC